MKINMLVRVRRHFNNSLVTRAQNRYNQRAWVRAVRMVGDRWLLAAPMPRRDVPRIHS